MWLGVVVGRCEVHGGRAEQSAQWDMGHWAVPPLCLRTVSLSCPLPWASPAWRLLVEELVRAGGLCGVPVPLTVHVLQVRGAAAQPDVPWADRAGEGGGCYPLCPQNSCAAPHLPRAPQPLQPQAWVPPRCACQHCSGGDGCSPEEWGVSAATACDHGPQTPSMEVPSGLLRTWMWYLTPGRRFWRTTQVLAWTSPCGRGARLRSSCTPLNPPAHLCPLCVPAPLLGRLQLPRWWVHGY